MTALEWTPQNAFESGVLLGLRAAHVILERGQGIAGVAEYIAQMEDVKRRREMDAKGCRPALYADIFCAPIVHPSDIGLPASPADDFAAAVARMTTLPKAEPRRSPEGVSVGEEVEKADTLGQDTAQVGRSGEAIDPATQIAGSTEGEHAVGEADAPK